MTDLLESAIQAIRKNTPVFPCVAGKKTPATPHGFHDATTDQAAVREWWARMPAANLAVPTGARSGLIVIDLDVDAAAGKDGEAELAKLTAEHGPLPPTLESRTPRGGRHLFFRYPGRDVPSATNHPAPAIDVRADGGYVLVPPSVTERGEYKWIHRTSPAECPAWLLDLLVPRQDPATEVGTTIPCAAPNAEPATEEEARISAALHFVSAGDYDTWTKIGMAIHSEMPNGRGLALWDKWSRTCPEKYNERAPAKKWTSFKADRAGGVTLGTLFDLAKRGGWIPTSSPCVTLGSPSAKAIPKLSDGAEESDTRTPVLASVASVDTQPIRWLWPGRFALGKVSLIVGDPGVAKSHLTLWLAGRVSNAGQWPNSCERAPLGQVILLSAEDDIADTIRPRLEATGADLSRIHVLQAVAVIDAKSGKRMTRCFNLAADLDILVKALSQITDVRLIVVDPISAYLGSRIDSHCNSDIRALLAPLAEIAVQHDVAVVCVTHLNKGAQSKAMYRTTGSLAFVAAARAVWAVTRDDDDPERRLFIPIKNNLAKDGTGLAYRLEPWPRDANFARCIWELEPITISAEEALLTEDETERGERQEAEEWLIEELRQGPIMSNTIRDRSRSAGLAWATVRRAKEHAGVIAQKDGFTGGWTWALPKRLKSLEDAHVGAREIVSTFVDLATAANEMYHQPAHTSLRHKKSPLGDSEHLGGTEPCAQPMEGGVL